MTNCIAPSYKPTELPREAYLVDFLVVLGGSWWNTYPKQLEFWRPNSPAQPASAELLDSQVGWLTTKIKQRWYMMGMQWAIIWQFCGITNWWWSACAVWNQQEMLFQWNSVWIWCYETTLWWIMIPWFPSQRKKDHTNPYFRFVLGRWSGGG